jgi:O-antigen ligase
MGTQEKQYVFPAQWPIVLMIFAGFLSLANARYPGVSMILILKHIEAFIVVYFIVVNFLETKEDIQRVVVVTAVAGFLAAIYGIMRFSAGLESRVFGMHGGGYGAFIGASIICAVSIIFFSRRTVMRFVLLCMLPFLTLALLLSQTRAWTFGTLLALLVIFYVHSGKSNKMKLVVGLGALAALVLWLVQSGLFGFATTGSLEDATGKALQTGLLASDDKGKYLSGIVRLFIWWHGFNIYLQYPILGFGIGNLRFRNMFTGELGPADDPEMGFVDNHYLNVLFETGILGAIAWIWLMILVYRQYKALLHYSEDADWRSIAYALIGSLIVWAFGGIFWGLDHVHESTVMLAFLIGLVFAAGRISDKVELPSPSKKMQEP